jgi:hypothetical protein
MCRNITVLRGLQPPADPAEIEAAALQYVRKVGGLTAITARNEAAVAEAVRVIAAATTDLLSTLPDRKQPPPTVPPMRRLRARGIVPAEDRARRAP